MDTNYFLTFRSFAFIILTLFFVKNSAYAESNININNLEIKQTSLIVLKSYDHKYCRNWKMSKPDIKQYFLTADIITSEEAQLDYDWGGCNIQGKLIDGSNKYMFRINAGGIGKVWNETTTLMYGCKNKCNSIYNFKFYEE